MLEIKNLHAKIEDKEILKGVNLTLKKGEIVAIMGPNGSGKSTLANVIMGHPNYEVTLGNILVDGHDVSEMEVDERAKKGLFLSFQYPSEIPGVTLFNFLRTAINALRKSRDEKPMRVFDFTKLIQEKMKLLKMDEDFTERYLNEGFSGGEKKRAEILQLSLLNPKVAILDETDSGLDIDALRIVAQGVNAYKDAEKSVLLITHYQRILDYITPDRIIIFKDGKVAKEGGPELAKMLEEKGYEGV